MAFGFVWFCCFGGWEELCFVDGDLILCFFFLSLGLGFLKKPGNYFKK